jgi:hypothetical protein
VLFEDETDLTLFPPLRAAWAPKGQQASVRISGYNAKRVLFGTLDLATGRRVLLSRTRHRSVEFCSFLERLRREYRTGPITLILDEDPCHTAQRSQNKAKELNIRMLSLPHRSPELNPMDSLWRHVKQAVCANRQYPSILDQVQACLLYLMSLSGDQALTKGGILSPRFWLRFVRSKLIW